MDTNIEVEFRRLDLPTQLIPILVLAVAAVSCGPSPDSPEATGGDSPALEAGLFDNTGEKKLAVIMVDFPDAANPETVQEARSVVFTGDTSTRAYYSEVSYGRMSFVGHLDPQGGDVFGPVTIPFPSWPCEWDQWAPVAREMVASEGFDAANYDFAFYVFGGECTGFSRQHWSPPSMVVGGLSRGSQLHEGGHAFGWLHANSYVCLQNDERVTLSSNGCRIIEYGDLFSLMGSTEEGTASLLPPNNFLRGQFNWYQDHQVATLESTENEDLILAPVEELTDEIQVIRLPRVASNGEIEQYFYIEARSGLPNGGVLVRLATRFDMKTRPLLLDMHPETETFSDAALEVGERFEDPVTGASIELLAMSEDGRATIRAAAGQLLSCVHNDPSGSFLPTPKAGLPGEAVTMRLRVRSEEIDCGPVLLTGRMNLPPGWPQPEKPESRPAAPDGLILEATLPPGEEATLDFLVVPPMGMPAGDYPVSATMYSDFGGETEIMGTFTVLP